MVRAKFEVIRIEGDEEGKEIYLDAVYDENPDSENGQFFKYTPAGQISLQIVNPSAAETFKVGSEYYVDFTLVPQPASTD